MTPVRLPHMRQRRTQKSLDTRGLDLTADLHNPAEDINDPLVSIDAVTVARRDGQPLTANDLTISPAGSVSPWITLTRLGSPGATGFFVQWWQQVNFAIAASGPVDYRITVEGHTAAGRYLAWDAYQLVIAEIG